MSSALHEFKIEFRAMASPCELQLIGSDEASVANAADAAVAEVRRIEHKYSRYRADSVVSHINAAAGSGQDIVVDDETRALLDFAGQLHEASEGRFDITSGVLRRAWDFRRTRVPVASEVEALLALVGWHRVRWRPPCIALPESGMELDFGGIGKEYAADRAASVLAGLGVGGGFVNLGGDFRVLGPRAEGQPWRIALQHPRDADALLGHVELSQGALATSGDYERFIELDGRRYGHVLDARTGWPVSHWRCVSVIAPTCAAAGALCTLAMLMGDASPDFLRAQGVPHLAVRHDGQIVDRLGLA